MKLPRNNKKYEMPLWATRIYLRKQCPDLYSIIPFVASDYDEKECMRSQIVAEYRGWDE